MKRRICMIVRKKIRWLLNLLAIALLVLGVVVTVAPVEGALVSTPYKWRTNMGSYAKTYLAPLAADLTGDGKMEIVSVGGTVDYGKDGTVTALDGSTGRIIWQVSPGGIGMHSPFEIGDINRDGIQEIVIGCSGGALVLRGSDGNTYWRNRDAPAEENYPAIGDVDGDGYMEVFVCRGYGPYNGIDYITELSYDGKIIKQAPCWHPCWGGLTLADYNSDGRFELYQGDRSASYAESSDPYKGGGWGIRALDALTLTPLWNDSDVLCSSQCPMLADVDLDGVLDIVTVWQSGGIAVYNAANGRVLTTGGIYRKSSSLNLSSHSQSTVCDIDYDGHPEFITARSNSTVRIFDLTTWTMDAILNITCQEPPKAADVTGDGQLDLIVATMNSQYTYIVTYNNATHRYDTVQTLSGLLHANAFTLVQDVDGDGLNELVLSDSDGRITCYDTLARAPTPRVRSNLQFYSDRRCGVAEYVPLPGPAGSTLTVTAPNGGQSWVRSTVHTITWASSGSPGTNVKIELLKGGTLNTVISSSTANDGSYSWSIPSSQALGVDYRIRITSTSITSITDTSDSNFEIIAGTLTVTSPNGGQSWMPGTVHSITWASAGSPGGYVKIELLKGGILNAVISSSTANDGSYSWAIPSTQAAGTDYKIRITSTSIASITDTSEGNFVITGGALTIVSPNGGQNWVRGTVHTITWTSSGSSGSRVRIELLKGGVISRIIASNTQNDGSYSWTISRSQAAGADYRIRITSRSTTSITDSSDSDFAIS
jgi:hypothetical protein